MHNNLISLSKLLMVMHVSSLLEFKEQEMTQFALVDSCSRLNQIRLSVQFDRLIKCSNDKLSIPHVLRLRFNSIPLLPCFYFQDCMT